MTRIISNRGTKKDQNSTRPAVKCPISLTHSVTTEKGAKQQRTANSPITMEGSESKQTDEPIANVESSSTLQAALGLLIKEFQLLRESVDTVHTDYKDLKETISKQKEDMKQELTDKIDYNTKHLQAIASENKILKKENGFLKNRLDVLEQNQLVNSVMITGIQEGPFEQYNTMKLRVQETIAVTIKSGNSAEDLETMKRIEITSCNRVGKFRHNYTRPITVTFTKRDDKETFLSNKRCLPVGIFANEEFPIHIKQNRDCLRPIF